MFNPIGVGSPPPLATLSHRSRGHYRHQKSFSVNQVKTSERDLVETYVRGDNDEDKSLTRRFVEKTLSKFAWYNPNRDKPELDIKKGWAFYDHFTLARYEASNAEAQGAGTRRLSTFQHADPGTRTNTKLYKYFTTPISAVSEWGIGVALYFNAIRILTYGLLLAAIISIPNLLYYKSAEYNSSPDREESFTLMGSAVCTAQEWVTCEEGYCDTDKMEDESIPFAKYTDGQTSQIFIERNVCESGHARTVPTNYAVFIFLGIFTVLFNLYQRRLAVRLDESLLSGSDYSVHVKNPPPDARDPEEWRQFFLRFAEGPTPHIAACTIILNNEMLIWNLINRRICRFELQKLLPDTDIDDINALERDVTNHIEERDKKCRSLFEILFTFTVRPILKLINRFVPAEQLLDKIKLFTDNIKTFQEKDYQVKHVFVTFETEIGQRNALKQLQHGKIKIRRNKYDEDQMHLLFRNEILLNVGEPEDPDSTRYQDLTTPNLSKKIRVLITTIITLGLVALSAYLVRITRMSSPFFAGILTSVLNTIIPQIVKLLLLIEKHDSEGFRQRSLYAKITIFRWLLTVFLPKYLTDFRLYLSDQTEALIPAFRGIFLAEMFIVPVLRYLDLGGALSKHYFGPRASTPDQMYLCFKGSPYNLAERYTDVSKILLLSYFSASIYPVGLFFGSVALFLRFYVDKFLLIRTWRQAPNFSTSLATFSGDYFFTGAVVIGTIASAYFFAFFQFDNACISDETESQMFSGDIDVTFSNETQGVLTVASGRFARVCTESTCCQEQDFWNSVGFLSPWDRLIDHQDLDFTWMSLTESKLIFVYAITGICFLIGYVIAFFGKTTLSLFKSLYRGTYEESGQVQNIDYSTVEGIEAYVPQIVLGRFPFPLLFCNVDNIDEDKVGWADPNTGTDHKYREYNLIYDIDDIKNAPSPFQINQQDDPDEDDLYSNQPAMISENLFSTVTCWEREGNGMG